MNRKKHFISVLGTGKYRDTVYCSGEEEHKTPYIQEASIKLCMPKLKETDRITILMTEKARDVHWECKGEQIGLKERLENLTGLVPEQALIKEGVTETELWDSFQKMYDCIEDGEEIYCDITHGLRNIPLQLITVLNYARVLKHITIAKITYGAFEMREHYNDRSPIFDLSLYNDIMEWTAASEIFLKSGDGLPLYNVYRQKKKSHEREKDELYTALNRIQSMMNSIKWITGCVDTSRGKKINDTKKTSVKKSIYSASMKFMENYSEVSGIDTLKPFEPLLDKIMKSIERFQVPSATELGIVVVDWCIEKKLIQQGYTALDETMKTFICEYFGLDVNCKEYREDIAKGALNTISLAYKTKIDRSVSYGYWMQRCIETTDIEKEKLEQIYFGIPKEWSDFSNMVSEQRNDINHFGYQSEPRDYEGLEKSLKKSYEKFLSVKKMDAKPYEREERRKKFLNFTNHPSSSWCKKQLEEASVFGEIQDLAFPQVNPEMEIEDLKKIADEKIKEILLIQPTVVLCQGESTLSNYVANKLRKRGIKVVAACSYRNSEEIVYNGKVYKNAIFEFVKFREYIG